MPTALLKPGPKLSPKARAKDINDAFADPDVTLIVATIGGDEGVRVLQYLDRETIAANPKPLLGYSDVTNLHLFLWNLGHVSFYGGALMCQFAISGPRMHTYTEAAIKAALLAPDKPFQVRPSKAFQDGYLDWSDPDNMSVAKAMTPNPGWEWVGWAPIVATGASVEGVLWGGCLSTLFSILAVRAHTPKNIASALRGAVLFVETSEEFPSSHKVYSFFQCLGELGVLASAGALLMGRPQTCRPDAQVPRERYLKAQRQAVLRAIGEYCPARPLPVVFGMDFGHTDPQVLVPCGGTAVISGARKTITFHFQPHATKVSADAADAAKPKALVENNSPCVDK